MDIYGLQNSIKGIWNIFIDFLGIASYFNTPTLNVTWWYMSLAVFLVFIIPLIIEIYEHTGVCLVFISLFYKYILPETSFTIYFTCVTLGIFCSKENILVRLYNFKPKNKQKINYILKITISFLFMCVLLYMRSYYICVDAFTSVLCSYICMELRYNCKYIGKMLCFIGKHSMNIFLIHTLIYWYYFSGLIYSLKNWFLILSALTLSSLAVSIVVEKVKKRIGFYKAVFVTNRFYDKWL